MSENTVFAPLQVLDLARIEEGARMYGPSWKSRGGPGAYMVSMRKWDRLLVQLQRHEYNWEQAIAADRRAEGIMDDIRDLRCYLLMILAECAVEEHTDTDPLHYVTRIPQVQDDCNSWAVAVAAIPSIAHNLEARAAEYHWDIFRMLHSPVSGAVVAPWLRQLVWGLYRVEQLYGAAVPNVVKGEEPLPMVCVAYMASGMYHLLPEACFDKYRDLIGTTSRYPAEETTMDGTPVVLTLQHVEALALVRASE